ncbi:succinylglutamate desuccinylase/aspartoacylase family protein [Sphingomonas sanguinis]|jgi:predicted deacylase|uniref:Succinylglutamate desuccinylase/aspartoacylase family protein n=1 Tax=Sphingomonas sanguinis TaxID=33051 RepID=A0A7Y7QVY2_9SPHN|nr:succinylglutamate desuccinylase/aspartoacylase family protein [Sphingomonas sanguinis]MBZ6382409.1 succinylglutamate desuccinylase/aspartoacylase family protein [Sphingomonas sanguinis]NNG50600.1 succinylglutamate desuccinylase/aspartoacylase family protein [Sphingomonas sanguinis]NNG54678.1 succinylglutamate desuccinylase/aspartoacylase family protein [Sphingomonas sanguinis]NVP31707.1 succinylglutamate desuccinylase/aspartoacylase family protein [Sphingomonas sanguinis]
MSRLFPVLARPLLAVALFAALPTAVMAGEPGDRIDGSPVIEKLDVATMPSGKTRLWLRVDDNEIGQGYYVPIIVVKGAQPGPRFLLTAGIHGDELNGIGVIHQLVEGLDPATMKGTLIAMPGLNAPGLRNSTRAFTGGHNGSGDNLNRLIPRDPHVQGDEGNAAQRYARRLWSRVFTGNTDFAIDLHTQSRGGAYPAYVFVATPVAKRIAMMLRPDSVYVNAGIDGAVEDMLNANAIPAVTYELGGAEVFDNAMIARGLRGVRNVMIDRGMLPGKPDIRDPEPFLGNVVTNVDSPRGGWAQLRVKLNQYVKKGDVLAVVTDPFGRTIATLTAPLDARVAGLGTDPRTQPGDMVVRLLSWDDSLPCKRDGCPSTVTPIKAR